MKPISNGALRKDVSRVIWVWFKFPSELSDDNTQILDLTPSISLPDGLGEALMCERLVCVSNQALQDAKLLWGKVTHAAARTSDFVRFQIDCTILKDNLTSLIIRPCHAPQHSSHP